MLVLKVHESGVNNERNSSCISLEHREEPACDLALSSGTCRLIGRYRRVDGMVTYCGFPFRLFTWKRSRASQSELAFTVVILFGGEQSCRVERPRFQAVVGRRSSAGGCIDWVVNRLHSGGMASRLLLPRRAAV